MAKVAINGFGRIGRTFFKMAHGHPDFDIVAINDLGDIENIAYLLKYDTAYGMNHSVVEVKDGGLVVDGKAINFVQERDPKALPWGQMGRSDFSFRPVSRCCDSTWRTTALSSMPDRRKFRSWRSWGSSRVN